MTGRAAVIIPAAGQGQRMGQVAKPFLELLGQPLLQHALRPFLADARVGHIVVALPPDLARDPPAWLASIDSRVCTVSGGAQRHDSVRLALEAVPASVDVIVVHDAARPLVSSQLVSAAIEAAAAGRSVTAAVPVTDTLHEVSDEGRVMRTPDRSMLWRAQTPQAFPAEVLRRAHALGPEPGQPATDDAALVASRVAPVYVIPGDPANLKITVPEDLIVAEALLRQRG